MERDEGKNGAHHTFYRYSARRTGKNACLFSCKGNDVPKRRNHHGIFKLHEKDRSDPLYGRAILYCCDTEGNEYMLDELNKDAVFGEPFLLPTDSQHYYVRAAQETRIIFIDYEHVIKRCDQACHHHSQMVSNLLQLTAIQSRQQNERIYMLSRSSTRKKLITYLNTLSAEKHSKDLTLPMSYTALAQYLSVDRSAMTRELKNLEAEGIIEKNGKQIHMI